VVPVVTVAVLGVVASLAMAEHLSLRMSSMVFKGNLRRGAGRGRTT
jgi:hypothetical protein